VSSFKWVNYSTGRSRPLGHLTNFCTNFYDFFLISENSLKFANFFAEVTNSRSMASTHIFYLVAIETPGTWHNMAKSWHKRSADVSPPSQRTSEETIFMLQRLSMALQRGNAVSIQNTIITEWNAVGAIHINCLTSIFTPKISTIIYITRCMVTKTGSVSASCSRRRVPGIGQEVY